MKEPVLHKLNKLLFQFRHLPKYRGIKLPLRALSEFESLSFSDKNELRDFDLSFSPSPVFDVTATSGTTDSRLIILHSQNCYYAHLERLAKIYKCMGMKKGDLCLNICSYELNSGGRIMENAFKKIGAGVIPLGSLNYKELLAEALVLIKKLKPSILNSYTNQLYDIFSIIRKNHSIKKCIVNGEPLFDSYKKDIERMSGIKIFDNYGSMEFSGFAISKNSQEEHMRLFEDGLFIEILKANGTTDEVGEGKIVVTDLENTCMPFIRYILGDEVSIVKKGANKYIKVLGRDQDTILVDGEVFFKRELLKILFGAIKNPDFFIIVEKNPETYKDRFLINISKEDKFKIKYIESTINRKIKFADLISIHIHSGNIPKTSTGKVRHFIDLRKDDKRPSNQ